MSQITKKLLRSTETCVEDNLMGFVKLHSHLRLVKEHNVVIRQDIDKLKQDGVVTILSGGGAGHEPFSTGLVGQGMLTAAVSGAIFTSPAASNILAGIRLIAKDNPGGSLILVANYTGDRLNFGQAVERARLEGFKVEMIVIGEDCAMNSVNKAVGRRGLSGLAFVIKIAGAMSESGSSLEEIVDVLTNIMKNMGTIGVCQSACSLPGSGPLFQLGADELDLGLGIHGEVGVKRIKMRSSDAIVETMIKHMTNPDSASHLDLKKGDEIVVLMNNLGSLTTLEMNVISLDTITYLTQVSEVTVERAYMGLLTTSLEMGGFTITILHVNNTILNYLDAPTQAPAWQQLGPGILTPDSKLIMEPIEMEETSEATRVCTARLQPRETEILRQCITHACDAIEMNEAKLNLLDSGCGDGDCGTTLKTGAKSIRSLLDSDLDCTCPMDVFLKIGSVIAESMGGSSGGLLSIFFTSAAGALTDSLTPKDWCEAMDVGTRAMMQYGGASPGDRTMLDPLHAAYLMLKAQLDCGSRPLAALSEAVAGAREASKQTAGMKARAGRASYVGNEFLTHPDAGATAVVLFLEAILDVIKSA